MAFYGLPWRSSQATYASASASFATGHAPYWAARARRLPTCTPAAKTPATSAARAAAVSREGGAGAADAEAEEAAAAEAAAAEAAEAEAAEAEEGGYSEPLWKYEAPDTAFDAG